LAILHRMVGRRSRGRHLLVGHRANWHPKKTIIRAKNPIIKMEESREKAQRDSAKVYGFPRKLPEPFWFP